MKRAVFLMAAILLVGSAFAAVYKWIDENNEIHYSDKLPRDQSVQEVKLPQGPTLEDIEKAKERQTRIKEQLDEAAQDRDDKQDQCDQARSAVRQLSQPGPGVIHLQTGAKIIATGKKKEELLRHYEQRVKEYCH
jgi:hypothetical protein